MTAKEVKSEIQKVLDKVPENILSDILEYLKTIQGKSKEQVKLSANVKQILSEDKELLQKLSE